MRLTSSWPLLLLPLLACNTGGDNTGGPSTSLADTGTTSPATTDSPVTGTEPTNGTTSEPATTALTTTLDTTGEPATSTTTSGSTTSTTSTTDPGSSSGDTGMTPIEPCVTDKDCDLHDDCCACYGIPVGQTDPSCDLECDQSQCSALGIDHAICRFGVCTTDKLDCDASSVICKSLPPVCPAGSLPGVVDACWTGSCVPIANCNAVPDCGLCPKDTMCVQKISKQQTWPACEPIPAECAGEIDCECAGTFVCTDDFNICNDLGDNQLSCGCPAC